MFTHIYLLMVVTAAPTGSRPFLTNVDERRLHGNLSVSAFWNLYCHSVRPRGGRISCQSTYMKTEESNCLCSLIFADFGHWLLISNDDDDDDYKEVSEPRIDPMIVKTCSVTVFGVRPGVGSGEKSICPSQTDLHPQDLDASTSPIEPPLSWVTAV